MMATTVKRVNAVHKQTAKGRGVKPSPSAEEKRRKAFGSALAEAIAFRQVTQAELAEAIGMTQSAVSAWRTGEAEPGPLVVFACEKALDLGPGMLSRHLGYYPPESIKGATTIQELLRRDELLDDPGRRAVLAVYRELTTRAASRKGRPSTR